MTAISDNEPLPKLVVLSGAGISVESGLRTFRDAGGLWEGYRVEDVASPGGWLRDPAGVLAFYNQRRKDVLGARPNAAHRGIASLERHYEVTVVTQNIDDLHERAGSGRVLHLHGSILKMRGSLDTEAEYPVSGDICLGDRAPDGSQLRPAVVWFSEPVPLIAAAVELVREADVLVVIGTSLNVYPAAGLIEEVRPTVPVYVIDKSIPAIRPSERLHLLEMSATEGVRQLVEMLSAGLS